jgi:hypothetical protein
MATKTATRKPSAATLASWREAVMEDPQGEYAIYARERLEQAGCDTSDLPEFDSAKPVVSYGPGQTGQRPVVATYAPGTKIPETITAADVARGGTGGDTRTAKAEPKPTPGELGFIKRLLAERELIEVIGGVNLNKVLIEKYRAGTISKRQARELGDWLKRCPYKGQASAVRPATPKQRENVVREGARRQVAGSGAERVAEIVRAATEGEPVSFDDASFALDVLFASKFAPRDRRPASDQVAEEGFYARTETVDGQTKRVFYKVQVAHHGSGRPYAKRLEVWDEGERDASGKVISPADVSWEIARGVVFQLKPEQKLSLEEAAAFGQLYGVCCCCATILTDERSIAEGIGPICKNKL